MSIVALLISVPGLWLAVLAFRDQQLANRSQSASNAQDTQRYRQRFASRLSWIDAAQVPGRALLRIQNRSTATLRDVVILGDDGYSAILPGDIASCSILRINVVAAFGLWADRERIWTTNIVVFHDPVGVWVKDRFDLRPLTDPNMDALKTLAHELGNARLMVVQLRIEGGVAHFKFPPRALVYAEPATDCGEG